MRRPVQDTVHRLQEAHTAYSPRLLKHGPSSTARLRSHDTQD